MGQMSLVGPRPEVPHFGDGLINSVDNRFDLTRFSRRKAPSLGAILRMYGFETCEVSVLPHRIQTLWPASATMQRLQEDLDDSTPQARQACQASLRQHHLQSSA
jgi:hypothetical protein